MNSPPHGLVLLNLLKWAILFSVPGAQGPWILLSVRQKGNVSFYNLWTCVYLCVRAITVKLLLFRGVEMRHCRKLPRVLFPAEITCVSSHHMLRFLFFSSGYTSLCTQTLRAPSENNRLSLQKNKGKKRKKGRVIQVHLLCTVNIFYLFYSKNVY